jgi:hypothetical protein
MMDVNRVPKACTVVAIFASRLPFLHNFGLLGLPNR